MEQRSEPSTEEIELATVMFKLQTIFEANHDKPELEEVKTNMRFLILVKHIIESQQQEIARLKAENAAMHRAYMKNQGVSIPDGYSGAITFCGIPISEAIDRVTAHPKLTASLAAETARADAAVRALTAYEDALFDERDVAYSNGYSDGYQDGTRGT